MGSHSLPQEIFLTQGSNPDLLHCRQILYHLSHWRKRLCWHTDWSEGRNLPIHINKIHAPEFPGVCGYCDGHLPCYFLFWGVLRCVWDFSSVTRDQTHVPCIGRMESNYWTTREDSPSSVYYLLHFISHVRLLNSQLVSPHCPVFSLFLPSLASLIKDLFSCF